MDRRTARETAFFLLFEYEFKRDEDFEKIVSSAMDARDIEINEYVERVIKGTISSVEEIDALISKYAVGWKTNRMSKTSLTIMRLGTYEMLYMEDIPFSVSINEAVNLAKKYDHDKAPAFINGVLNAIADEKGLKQN